MPKQKSNTIAIIVSFVLLAVIMAYVLYEPAEPEVVAPKVEAPKEKISLSPVAESIVLTEPLWMNPPEDINMVEVEDMVVKFKMTNHNTYPVTGITVRFSFYDISGVDLEGAQEITFDDIIEASGEISLDDIVVGQYPIETIKVKGEVLSVAAAE
ncbi:MAG: hypothetical protein GWP68_06050 [Verrucomicrobiaceae bacterium]|nr:hypothetical protein [Verrucomicrobiaceae bacterium]